MTLVLKYVQNFIKICKTLVGALTHTCTLCTSHISTPPLSHKEILYETLHIYITYSVKKLGLWVHQPAHLYSSYA